MAYRVEITKTAEADLESLYAWVIARAPHQGASWFNNLETVFFAVDDRRRIVRVLHVRHAATRRIMVEDTSR